MKAFKVVRINEEMEVAAFNGNIVRNKEGEPVVHAHCVVGILSSEKSCRSPPSEEVSLTLQVYVTDNGPLKAAAEPERRKTTAGRGDGMELKKREFIAAISASGLRRARHHRAKANRPASPKIWAAPGRARRSIPASRHPSWI
jgi:hypothetical protein